MNIIINFFRIIVRTRIIIFIFIVLICLDSLIFFYYPKYQLAKDIHTQKKSITEYINIISESISDESEAGFLSNDRIISFLKINPRIKYIAIPDSNDTIIYPAELISLDQLNSLRFDEIVELNGQNALSLKIIPPLKYSYKFNQIYLGLNADGLLDNREEYFKTAFIVIGLSFILFWIFVILYFLDLYKPLNRARSNHINIENSGISKDNLIHEDGILQLKSHLIHRKRELKSINNILAATIKSQRNFIKVISHDLKAPLRNVSGLVDSIFRKYPDTLNKDVADRLSRIKKNVDKEREMISEILRNITSQKKILKYEKVDVNAIILSIIEDLEFEIQEKQINIKIKSGLPNVYSNKIILKHVFQNLLDNACKYFPKEGVNKIEITFTENSADHIFSVKDTGPGISKDVQKTLFHTYDYNQAANLVEDMDSGLGLELVSTFIEIINGKIWLESEIGEGSTFFISLSKLDDTKAGIFE